MIAAILLAFREGVEAALIIGIILGVLNRIGQTQLNRYIWLGAALAGGLSLLLASLLLGLGLEFEGTGEQIFEGTVMLLAASVLTWMLFWMKTAGKTLSRNIEHKAKNALKTGGGGLLALSFFTVLREGVELALFLLAIGQTSKPATLLSGELIGLGGAAILGWLVFSSSHRMSLRGYFRITNILVVVFTAGLIANSASEFIESGLIPAISNSIWNLNGLLPDTSQLGLLLKALVGYHSAPSLTVVLFYFAYLIPVTIYLFLDNRLNRNLNTANIVVE